MSKLRERIREASQRRVRTLGFVRRAEEAEAPQLLVMAEVTDADGARAAIEAGARALLFGGSVEGAAAVVEASGGAPVGMRIDAATPEDSSALASAGVDFLVYDAERTAAETLLERKLGSVLVAPAPGSDDELRRYGALGLDAVLVGEPGSALSVRGQLEMRRLAELTRAPLAVQVNGDVPSSTLEVWRDGGAAIVVLPSSAVASLGALVAASRDVRPPRMPEQEERPQPLVPAAKAAADEDDDDDMDVRR